jgi:hypothetical protein
LRNENVDSALPGLDHYVVEIPAISLLTREFSV